MIMGKQGLPGTPIAGEEGIDEEKTDAIHKALTQTVLAHLPTNGVTMLSAVFYATADIALTVGISEDDTVEMMRLIYRRQYKLLEDTLPPAKLAELKERIANTSLHDGAAPDA